MPVLTGYVAVGVGVVLALSLGANAFLFHERDKILEAKATTEQLRKDTAAAAAQCTSSVEGLAAAGRDRDKRLERALAGIAPQVRADQQAAMAAMRARPDDPKDLCGSLERYLRRELKSERGKP